MKWWHLAIAAALLVVWSRRRAGGGQRTETRSTFVAGGDGQGPYRMVGDRRFG